MASTDFLERKLLRLEQTMAQLRQHYAYAGGNGGDRPLDPIMGDEDRRLLMRFLEEIYHRNIGVTPTELAGIERIWATQHPKEYQRIIRICGLVPVEER